MAMLVVSTAVSAKADSSHDARTNPLIIESQIEDVSIDGDDVTIHVFRQPYDIVAKKWQRVSAFDGRQMYASDLQVRDNVRIDGDLDPHSHVVTVRQVKLTMRRGER
jgi:hypothetical protein